MQDGGHRHVGKISSGDISATGRPIYFMFCSRVRFSMTADLIALFSIRTNSRWRPPPSWIISNGYIHGFIHGYPYPRQPCSYLSAGQWRSDDVTTLEPFVWRAWSKYGKAHDVWDSAQRRRLENKRITCPRVQSIFTVCFCQEQKLEMCLFVTTASPVVWSLGSRRVRLLWRAQTYKEGLGGTERKLNLFLGWLKRHLKLKVWWGRLYSTVQYLHQTTFASRYGRSPCTLEERHRTSWTYQRWATKLVKGSGRRHYEERLKVLGIYPLHQRRFREGLIETYKILTGRNVLIDSCFSRWLRKYTISEDILWSLRLTMCENRPENILQCPSL